MTLRQQQEQARTKLVEFIRRDLFGPAQGETETIEEPPTIRYLAGVLFPQQTTVNESSSAGGVEDDWDPSGMARPEPALPESDLREDRTEQNETAETGDDDIANDEVVSLANAYRPSAVGMSFVVDGSARELVVTARAAVYESEGAGDGSASRSWKRKRLELQPMVVPLQVGRRDIEVAGGLKLCVVCGKDSGRGIPLTISLYNSTAGHRTGTTFFQTGFDVAEAGNAAVFNEYLIPRDWDDEEEQSLAMLYRNRRVYAVGHGCAVAWAADGKRATQLSTDAIPAVVVPPIVPRQDGGRCFSMEFLSGGGSKDDVIEALTAFCVEYGRWIEDRQVEAANLDPIHANAASRHLNSCREVSRRMREGVQFLAKDKKGFEAFSLMNRAMLMQQFHASLRRRLEDPPSLPVSYTSDKKGYWRAFQLAFVLIVIPGLDPQGDSTDRDLVDLIWFPTGGGKTEAYLALTAFVLLIGRLQKKPAAGCRVLMRYTLRLLTSQQFQRAASLICACEFIRRTDEQRFGREPFAIGLWVGKSLTPNKESDAQRAIAKLSSPATAATAKNPFQLLSCPWCGTELDSASKLGYRIRNNQQIFLCPNDVPGPAQCPFSQVGKQLPVRVVDEAIYREPPSLLLGTVDKFAMLAWNSLAGRLFADKPELIIQDELHLISGPLGSMVGLYESVIDYMCTDGDRRPKIIASTATIRRAEEQCLALYDRKMCQFPPPGLDASDSYFAFADWSHPGRLYVGLLPTAASSSLTAQVRSVAALHQGSVLCAARSQPEVLDPYWTLVQYFSSLKELGRAATFVSADIPEFLPAMHRRYDLQGDTRRWMITSEELTSRKNEDEIPKILRRLEDKYASDAATLREQALDTLLATNMISVGVDVARLGLMMIVTQPKGTSEYIQASSRVGRSAPGLVFTLYNPARPRDRSHYEQFRGYHEAFYRFVEPTSVTPFAPQALERALHAVCVIAGRHIAGFASPSAFDVRQPSFSRFLEFLRARVRSIDEERQSDFERILATRLQEWSERNPEVWGTFSREDDGRSLMRPAGAEGFDEDAWETPTSMRNVDVECIGEVVQSFSTVSAK